MPLREPTGSGRKGHIKVWKTTTHHPRKAKKKKVKKTRAHKASAAKAHKVRTPATHAFHEAAGASSAGGGAGAGALPFASAPTTAGAPRALLELSGLDAPSSAEGLMGAILDLVGEGTLTAAHALAAWTHEQDRLANRAWRRPGGLARMGGL